MELVWLVSVAVNDIRAFFPPPNVQLKHLSSCFEVVLFFNNEVFTLFRFQHIVSWEPEGRYCRSKMFRWEPEGRYCHWLCTAIVPLWFSMEHLWAAITPFWLSTDDVLLSNMEARIWEIENNKAANSVSLRTRRVLMLYKVCSISALLFLNDLALVPFCFSMI